MDDVNAAQHACSSNRILMVVWVWCSSQTRVTVPKFVSLEAWDFRNMMPMSEEGRNPGQAWGCSTVGSWMQSSGHSRTLRLRLRLKNSPLDRSRESGLGGGLHAGTDSKETENP